ncbi:hypothetical protein FJTKL_03676 [Diaporthe vaccinii]|uniref:PRELI/MSF1 domain-containing protein n=1 Tax=Diaporthe vaccinii TaxID=105482 RepID=A0ABR4DUK7_9PEZI
MTRHDQIHQNPTSAERQNKRIPKTSGFANRGHKRFTSRLPSLQITHSKSSAPSHSKMKVFSSSHTFNYSWEEVTTANWRKYCPWNEQSTHVVAVDTLARSVEPSTGILRTERLITCKQSAPEWMKSIVGAGDVSQVFETSYVDPAHKTVTMVSWNLTWSNLINCQETVIYKPMGDHQTQFAQEAKITALCGGWQRIKNKIEDFSVNRFRDNAIKGKEGFEAVLAMSRRVFAEEREKEKMKMALAA